MKKMQADNIDAYAVEILPHMIKLFKDHAINILSESDY